ncbi:hypothetical protein FJT64_004263 [Amphibalanus amphitrite]|uniref:HAT C-terminal dimerisation domain-containing protein n=1 Tax=Amphibalanus amphitrite TaxID=1232801 RepID=A0A6A4VUA5_AMPAM|nr:hypothetical protein FJT64_004263 [Amphibalanus amphitrite]
MDWTLGEALKYKQQYAAQIAGFLSRLNVNVPDCRYIMCNKQHLDAIRAGINTIYKEAVPKAQSLLAAWACLIRHLDGRLSDMRDGTRTCGQDNRINVTNYTTKKHIEKQRNKIDVKDDALRRLSVQKEARRHFQDIMSEPKLTSFDAIRARQFLLVEIVLFSGHRTGVWTGITLEEWEKRESNGPRTMVLYEGGKNRRVMGATTAVLSTEQASLVSLFVQRARSLLPTATNSDLLFPGLQPHNLSGIEDDFVGLKKGELTRMCGGNICRQFHSSLTLTLADKNLLTAEDSRRAAFYRRHSLGVAERVYDRRHQAATDAAIQGRVLDVMMAWLNLDRGTSHRSNDSFLAQAEEARYLSEEQQPMVADPLKYWAGRKAVFPQLEAAAMTHVAITASPGPSERIFSVSGNLFSRRHVPGCERTS